MDDFSVTPRKHRQRSQRQKTAFVKRFRSNRAGSVEITQDDSASKLTQRQSSPADSSQQPELTDDGRVDRSSVSSESESSRKKPQNQSLWAQFDILELPGKLCSEIRCTRCNWRTTDSARATSTSNMRFHLTKHGISSSGSESSNENDKSSTKQPSIASFFQKRAEDNAARSLERNLQIFRDLGISLPFSSRMTMARRIDTEFQSCRTQLIDEL
ncbi:hypothetical protein LIPSTDRAFT_76528 [Lipomyces starkeyi NRRL Y-11557]|uniref:BED-type domain-containing protein n=1 Tax=Lipomyces starkeyi NRRL Y-11557 TaxID=675824 RepID=A0A1E3PUF8_LIPST|nr:hypothetical protein LIPSTDRAFT_76528 [Lipomyces starkeyi NRRL Y-11557]